MTRYYLIVVLSVLAGAVAQMLLKKGAGIPRKSVVREYLNFWVIAGYALMGAALIANIFAMSRGVQVKEVSIIESLSYLFVPVLALICFKERISRRKVLSIALILVGIIIFFQ